MASTPVPLKEPLDRMGQMFVTNGVWQRWFQSVPGEVSALSGWTQLFDNISSITADAPTFVFTLDGDQTDKYHVGMRLRITQGTVKYLIVTGVAYVSPSTSVTVYGGTDYTVTTSPVTEAYGSISKAPLGFPMDPSKWSVRVTDSTNRSQASPTANTWYNLGGTACQISLPIGVWYVGYSVSAHLVVGGGPVTDMYTTLSTANNSASDSDLSSRVYLSTPMEYLATMSRNKTITTATKTQYYLNAKTGVPSVTSLNFLSQTSVCTMVIEAVSAYL